MNRLKPQELIADALYQNLKRAKQEKKTSVCIKCGEPIKSDGDSLCGYCAGEYKPIGD